MMDKQELNSTSARSFPRHGEIYEAELDRVIGSETGKRRLILVVSNDINNEFSQTITILPITNQPVSKHYPFEVLILDGTAGLVSGSRIKANQVRTIDKRRLAGCRGSLPPEYVTQVDKALKIHLDIK